VTLKTTSTENIILESASPAQHGIHGHDTGGIALPPEPDISHVESGAASATAPTTEQLALDATFAASLQRTEQIGGREGRRLSPAASAGSPSPPPATQSATIRNRIEDYEKASTLPVGRKREGPAFEVLKKPRAPGDKRSPIVELPNGTPVGIFRTVS
jgi:hypothetical protein